MWELLIQCRGHQCGMSIYVATPTLHCNKCSSVIMSLKRSSLLAPKRAVFVAGVFFVAARRLRAGDAGESPYGSGDWRGWSRYWCSWRVPGSVALNKGVFGVAEFSTRSMSAGSQPMVARRGVGQQRPVCVWACVGGLRCVALLRAACCESVMSTQAGPTVYGA
jgi:hypothetical protein